MLNATQSEDGTGEDHRRQAWMEWTDPALISAWIRWKDKAAIHHAELTRFLLSRAGLFEGAQVLDLASGTGEATFSVASVIGPNGRLVATELSAPLILEIYRGAASRGIPNLEVVQADATKLPFPDSSFDIVLSKLSVMYFVPPEKALAEIRRVMKPGGRVALMAWGMPEQGTYYAACVFPFLMRSSIVPPPPDAPTPLRFSPPGSLSAEMSRAGFKDVVEERKLLELKWPGPPPELWRHLYEIASPLRIVFDSLSPTDFQDAYNEAMALLHKNFDGETTTLTIEVNLGIGIN
jgi:SAM-dependent methyltransferase